MVAASPAGVPSPDNGLYPRQEMTREAFNEEVLAKVVVVMNVVDRYRLPEALRF